MVEPVEASSSQSERASRVERFRLYLIEWKDASTILIAIVVGLATSIWSLFNFSYKVWSDYHEAKISAANEHFLDVSLSGEAVAVNADTHWFKVRVKLHNTGKRPIHPVAVTCLFSTYGDAAANRAPTAFVNAGYDDHGSGFADIHPGQPVAVACSQFIHGATPATSIQVKVSYAQTREDEVCILDPSQFTDGSKSIAEQIANLKHSPKVCIANSSGTACADPPTRSCVMAKADVLVAPTAFQGGGHEVESKNFQPSSVPTEVRPPQQANAPTLPVPLPTTNALIDPAFDENNNGGSDAPRNGGGSGSATGTGGGVGGGAGGGGGKRVVLVSLNSLDTFTYDRTITVF